MSSLKGDFNELLERVRQGREFAHASFEPIYYLVFHPSQILDVKRQTPAWVAKLRNEGWEVTVFSIAENIADILANAPMRKVWLVADSKNPLDWEKTNKSLANALTKTRNSNRGWKPRSAAWKGRLTQSFWSRTSRLCTRTCE